MTALAQAEGALEADATLWSAASTDLHDAATVADGIDISDWDWPVRGSLEVYYRDIQTKVVDLLNGGSTQTGDLSDYLLQIRATLLGTDQAAKDALRGLWDF
jgi:hypothetical protein